MRFHPTLGNLARLMTFEIVRISFLFACLLVFWNAVPEILRML